MVGNGGGGVSIGPRKMHVVVVAMARRGAAAKSSGRCRVVLSCLLLKVSSLASMVSML